MCGIFGVIPSTKSNESSDLFADQVRLLMRLSESRGKDASGIAIVSDQEITYCKSAVSATQLFKTPEVQELLHRPYRKSERDSRPVAVIGHARMETNGSYANNDNNQPVVRDGIVTLHNGIVVNDEALWKKYDDVQRHFQVDTEIINALFRQELQRTRSLVESAAYVFFQIEGSASLSILFEDYNSLLLVTNTGSLYTATDGSTLYFASERYFLESFIRESGLAQSVFHSITQLAPQTGMVVDLDTIETVTFAINTKGGQLGGAVAVTPHQKMRTIREMPLVGLRPPIVPTLVNSDILALVKQLEASYAKVRPQIDQLRRCTKCILPETMPYITFDKRGVCSYCTYYQPINYQSPNDLEKIIAPYRRNDGRPDCLLPFSGGRDSSFGLHVAVKELGLHPVAFSYDWGMLTDLGRRNQARMCGSLGVEHILISADIQQKRANIRKNVLAWLRRPQLGTIPLFMAGDKQYFYYINKLQKQMRLPLALYMENRMEKTDFKSGFCGVPPRFNIGHGYNLGFYNKIKMAGFYFRQYLQNPSLINSSMLDTLTAFLASYFIPHNYVFLFQYMVWEEAKVAKTLIEQYNWETSPDIPTTWRIGDGTAPFYNFIYYTVAGFTENDTFRSNQIREGQMRREEALAKVQQENHPTLEPIRWYCETIGVNLQFALERIGTMSNRFGEGYAR